jgi:DNA-directed RNA polymerase alpha subunit
MEIEIERIAIKKRMEAWEDSADKQSKLSQELKELLDTRIDELGFPKRVMNVCLMADIYTISDLIRYTRKEFGKLRNSGKKSGDDVEAFLKSKGLNWKIKK